MTAQEAVGPAATGDQVARTLGAIALVGLLINAAALILAPALRPDVDLLRHSLSHYAVGPYGEVQSAAFVALGVSCLALALALPRVLPAGRWLLATMLALLVAALGCVGLSLFPMGDPNQPTTILGDYHQTAGTFAVVAQFLALVGLLRAIRPAPAWHDLQRTGAVLGVIAFVGIFTQEVSNYVPHGVPEGITIRVLIVPMLTWWALVALKVRQVA